MTDSQDTATPEKETHDEVSPLGFTSLKTEIEGHTSPEVLRRSLRNRLNFADSSVTELHR